MCEVLVLVGYLGDACPGVGVVGGVEACASECFDAQGDVGAGCGVLGEGVSFVE